ncbi:MAG TPA: tetratricopeptide repeat protein, partial [Pyrinomonadaceae bacterium]|nr:tetratricopeptide repeat protein [Pyrinomonadaceae bacterium]
MPAKSIAPGNPCMHSSSSSRKLYAYSLAALILLVVFAPQFVTSAQAGNHKLFGDLHVDESRAMGSVPLSYDILLYSLAGNVLQRLSIPNGGRYQFLGLADNYYDVVVEVENRVVARTRVAVFSSFRTDFRHDIELEWRSAAPEAKRASIISAADIYKRDAANEKIFRQAAKEIGDRKYDQAAVSLRQLLASDPRDFQAWLEFANVEFLQRKFEEAERDYLHAIDARPGLFLAFLNLGRLEITVNKYDVAVEALTKAVRFKPESADANYFLGDAYLRMKKGSQAVPFLNEAIRLDPDGMAEVHLRLAALYDAAG